MGNRKSKINWSWPLISYQWIPDILASIEESIEPSWEGLKRNITANVANVGTGNKIFRQLQALLLNFNLVREEGRFISPTVTPTENEVFEYLQAFFYSTNQDWTNLYYDIINKQLAEINYDSFADKPPQIWPAVENYSIFKQWTEFLQYLGLCILINNKQFILCNSVTLKMARDFSFIEKSCKSMIDPRHLTGRYCLHTDADFLGWSNGEDALSISEDKLLHPRIPPELIVENFQNVDRDSGWSSSVKKGIAYWDDSIKEKLASYPFANLSTVVITSKILLDYFIFGSEQFEVSNNIEQQISVAKLKWEAIPNFIISGTVWRVLPSLYKSINRLFYGVTHYRNSLRRNIDLTKEVRLGTVRLSKQHLDELKLLPIRCMRSKKSLHAILQNMTNIQVALDRVSEKRNYTHFREHVLKKHSVYRHFLPNNYIEKRDLLEDLGVYVDINQKEKDSLLSYTLPILSCNYADANILLSFWVHQFNNLKINFCFKTIDSVEERLRDLINRKRVQTQKYKSNIEIWDHSVLAFKHEVTKLKGRIL